MPSNHLIFCHPLLLLSIFPSIRVFSSELVLHIRGLTYWSFSFSISLSNEYSGLVSCRIDWLDLFALQGILKNLLQHHSSKASVLWCSAFFIVQLSHLSMTTGKTIALTRWTFVGKVMFLLLNMLSRLVIAFLPRSKHLLISFLLTVAYQALLSMGFSRQEYWSGLPFPSPGDLPNPGIEPRSPALQVDALPSEPPGKPFNFKSSAFLIWKAKYFPLCSFCHHLFFFHTSLCIAARIMCSVILSLNLKLKTTF